VYIAQRFQGRRRIIFEEIDRKGGSTWAQILEVCLGVVNGITTRITEYESPPATPATAAQTQDDPGLPRLASPLKDDNIYSASAAPKSRSAAIAQTAGSIAKLHGQSPSDPPALKMIEQARSMLPIDKNKALSNSGIYTIANQYTMQFLQSPMGQPFRQEYRRRMAFVVLGTPYGDLGLIVDAIDSLTRFAVCSLKEDPYGNVQRDVPTIIRTFTATIAKLEGFKQRLGTHWTDIEKKQESPEVDTILAVLKGGLQELLAAFGDYSEDLRLSQRDMREAREAATPVALKVVEMKEK
jgi:Nucleoporin protein Ndc1-Nup